MSRLFLRIYAALSVGLVAAILSSAFFAKRSLDRSVQRQLAAIAAIPAKVLAESIAQSSDRDRTARELSRQFGYPIRVLRRRDLDASEEVRRKLAKGAPVARVVDTTPMVFAPLGRDDLVAVIGPLPGVRFIGEGRGLYVFGTQFLVLAIAVLLLVRPLEVRLTALSHAARRFGDGDLAARADSRSRDAVGQLGQSFNQMAERIENLLQAHKELFRAVSHELRTPVMRIQLALELLANEAGQGSRERIAGLEQDVKVLESLVEELLVYARLEPGVAALHPESVELDSLLGPAVRDAGRLRPEIRVDLVCLPATEVSADARLLQRALGNLVINAVRHARSAVRITVASGPAGSLTIDVDDDGAGVPPADRERIFEPFVRLECARPHDTGGTGLGLAIVRRVALAHGARVTALDGPLGGARFRWQMGP